MYTIFDLDTLLESRAEAETAARHALAALESAGTIEGAASFRAYMLSARDAARVLADLLDAVCAQFPTPSGE